MKKPSCLPSPWHVLPGMRKSFPCEPCKPQALGFPPKNSVQPHKAHRNLFSILSPPSVLSNEAWLPSARVPPPCRWEKQPARARSYHPRPFRQLSDAAILRFHFPKSVCSLITTSQPVPVLHRNAIPRVSYPDRIYSGPFELTTLIQIIALSVRTSMGGAFETLFQLESRGNGTFVLNGQE